MSRITASLAALTVAIAIGCAPSDPVGSVVDEPVAGGAAGMCLEGVPDCVDVIIDVDEPDPDAVAEFDRAVIRDARALLGLTEAAALGADDVRLGRRGDEHFALTQDYVVGRKTIATADDGTGTLVVVEVVVEASHGPVTLTRNS